MIVTVLGPVESSAVTGACSPHEHLLNSRSASTTTVTSSFHTTAESIILSNLREARRYPERFAESNRLFSTDEGVQELQEFVAADGGLLFECTAVFEGRDPNGLVEISTRTGVHVIMGASCKIDDVAPDVSSLETIGKEYQRQLVLGEEVLSGVQVGKSKASRVRAGFILLRVEGTPSAGRRLLDATDRLALRAAAWARAKTGAPIVVTFPPFPAFELVQSVAGELKSEPTSPARHTVLTGMHGGTSQSLDDQVGLLHQGFALCFDCFGAVEWSTGPEYFPPDEESAIRVAKLIAMGFVGQVLISQAVSRRVHLSRCGGFGYAHALLTVPQRLRRLGVRDDDIRMISRDNALRLANWYTPPPSVETPKNFLACSWDECGKRFEPVEGSYFHKYSWVYCRIKCLRAHRDTGFDEARTSGSEQQRKKTLRLGSGGSG